MPGKPLVKIAGVELVAHVIRGVRQASAISEVLVATDDERIAAVARREGVAAVMTHPDLPSGTDRCLAALRAHAGPKWSSYDVVVNIQGDEPLISGEILGALIEPFQGAPLGAASPESAKPVTPVQMSTLAGPLESEADLLSPSVVKVLVDRNRRAVYFSRLPIPFSRVGFAAADVELKSRVLKHAGLYAYTPEFLETFCRTPVSPLERAEGLEQLRALDLGAGIHVGPLPQNLHGVDTPEDVEKIENWLQSGRRP